MTYLSIFILVVLQNASFTLVSRARNSDSVLFHGIASTLSNMFWLIVIRKLVLNFNDIWYMGTYLVASVSGSMLMHYYSMKFIEKFFKKK